MKPITTISKEDTQIILREMCNRVGVAFETLDVSAPFWYLEHEWTVEQEDEFVTWLALFLRKKKYVAGRKFYRGTEQGIYEAQKMVANFGWKTKGKKKCNCTQRGVSL